MRLKGRQARFLLLTLACWSGARAYLLWPLAADDLRRLPTLLASTPARAQAPVSATRPPETPVVVAPAAGQPDRLQHFDRRLITMTSADRDGPAVADPQAPSSQAKVVANADRPVETPAPLFPVPPPGHRRIEAQAYVFWRPGATGPGLAEHGELGGSQFAARIAVPLGARFAVAGRIYAPIEHRGAETAIGIDWRPLSHRSFRLSVERRQRLDALGRSAWSAYAAGGFWRGGGPGSAQVDGYAQAGVVGTQRRDLFVDGALRIGYRLPTAKAAITLGAGLWGAAQPQVARLDIGPRAAIVLPVARHSLTLAIDGRFRTAGNAAPGSGAALTIAADF